ncbi:hypothetical protein [Terrabacter sp. 2RAF25]|uniref:hypothetical protein n=1 Tax=Terrabacter sp. 2RAF25 TaxID=3232998 RepID=UPI003F9DD254
MPARRPFRRATLLRLALVGLAVAAVVVGGWSSSRRAPGQDATRSAATGELAVQAAATGASKDTSGLRPLSGEVAALVPDEPSWVEIPWTSDAPVCAVSVMVTAEGASVTYPWSTRAFSSFYREDRLAASAKDYTAVRVRLPASTTATTVSADGDDRVGRRDGQVHDEPRRRGRHVRRQHEVAHLQRDPPRAGLTGRLRAGRTAVAPTGLPSPWCREDR